MDIRSLVYVILTTMLVYLMWSCNKEKFTSVYPHTTQGGCAAAVNQEGFPLAGFYAQVTDFAGAASEPLYETHNSTCDCLTYWAQSYCEYLNSTGQGGFGCYWPTQCSPNPEGEI